MRTTTLFAAPVVKSGPGIGEWQLFQTAREFIYILRPIGRCVKKHLDIHPMLRHYGGHEVRLRVVKPSRFKPHFTPTSASWASLVE